MEKEEGVAMTERGFFCFEEVGFYTLPLCHETAVYPKQKWRAGKKMEQLPKTAQGKFKTFGEKKAKEPF